METISVELSELCGWWLETKYRDIADSKQVYWRNRTALLSCHQALCLLQTLGAIHCANPNKNNSRLAFLFSPRQHAQILVEFGTNTRSIPTIYAWRKSRQADKLSAQQVYWQLKARSASAISPLRRPAETLSLTVKSVTSLFFYRSLYAALMHSAAQRLHLRAIMQHFSHNDLLNGKISTYWPILM